MPSKLRWEQRKKWALWPGLIVEILSRVGRGEAFDIKVFRLKFYGAGSQFMEEHTKLHADSLRFSKKQQQKAKKKAATVSESGTLSHFSISEAGSLSLSDSGTESN